MIDDEYQRLYLEHQQRKRASLRGDHLTDEAVVSLRSVRRFRAEPVTLSEEERLVEAVRQAPSSCNRHPVSVGLVTCLDGRMALERLLVGGAGWLAGAPLVMLFFADGRAYKGPREIQWMPWLDCAAALTYARGVAYAMGLGSCWVNPYVRDDQQLEFNRRFNPELLRFGSALAVGHPAEQPPEPPRPSSVVYYRE